MFNIFIGFWWMVIFAILAVALGFGVIFSWEDHKGRASVLGVLAIVAIVFGVVSEVKFRVPINEKSLIVNTLTQTIVGVRESGIQNKELIGNQVTNWPANSQYPVSFSLGNAKSGPNVSSVTNKNGSAVALDITVYMDLSDIKVVEAFKAFNGDWNVFRDKFLIPQLGNLTRDVTKNYTSWELDTKLADWDRQYEASVAAFLESGAGKQFGIKLVPNRTVMQWDFVDKADASAFDSVNRAGYSIAEREQERQALLVEAQMAQIRSNMAISNTAGAVVALSDFSAFIQRQPAEMRPYVMGYLPTLQALEYLRTVNALRPMSVFPPAGGPVLTFNVNSPITSTTVMSR